MTSQEAQDLVDLHVAQLREHFDAVQILVSHVVEDGSGNTLCMKRGGGNWYARQGMAHEFIQSDQAHELGAAVARSIREDES